jgi:hypothetical protein
MIPVALILTVAFVAWLVGGLVCAGIYSRNIPEDR